MNLDCCLCRAEQTFDWGMWILEVLKSAVSLKLTPPLATNHKMYTKDTFWDLFTFITPFSEKR